MFAAVSCKTRQQSQQQTFAKILHHMGKLQIKQNALNNSWTEKKTVNRNKNENISNVFLKVNYFTLYNMSHFSHRSKVLRLLDYNFSSETHLSYFLLLAFEKRANLKPLGHPLFSSYLSTSTSHSGHIQVKRDRTKKERDGELECQP